jgi:GTP cyclohydrolase I
VEDVVRNVAGRLEKHTQVTWFRVEVESFESIHAHNAYARIERHCKA